MCNTVLKKNKYSIWIVPILALAYTPLAGASTAVTGYEVSLKQAKLYIKEGKSSLADSLLSRMSKKFPGNAEVSAVLVRLRCSRNEFDRANIIINDFPSAKRSGEFSSAIRECNQLQELSRAQENLRKGDYRKAINISSNLYDKKIKRYASGLVLAKAYVATNNLALAEKTYRELSSIFPHDKYLRLEKNRLEERLKLEKAEWNFKHKNYKVAIRISSVVYRYGENKYRAGLILANSYLKEKNTLNAEKIYNQLAKRYPNDKELHSLSQNASEELKLDRAEKRLKRGDIKGCIQLAKPIYLEGRDRYRSGLILARAYESASQFEKALNIYQTLAKEYPKDASLATRYQTLKQNLAIKHAQQLVKVGAYTKAIAIANPIYESGSDTYSAGLVLAKAYTALHKPEEAARVYRTLSKNYPRDRELARGNVLSELAAHDYYRAAEGYQNMDISEKAAIDSVIGYQSRHLYPYAFTLGGGAADWSNQYPNEHYFNMRLRGYTPIGTLIGTILNDQRYGLNATSYGVEYYGRLGSHYSSYLAASYSPQNTILAHYSYSIGIQKYFKSFSVMGSYRHLVFSNSNANVWFAGISQYLTPNLNVKYGIYYVPSTSAYSVLLAPKWYESRGETFMYLSAGQMGEQINVQGNIYKAPSYSLKLGQRIFLSKRWSATIDAYYEHRGQLYNRKGIEAFVTWRW